LNNAEQLGAAVGPEWLRTLEAWLAVRPQFVLSGNIRDLWMVDVVDTAIGSDTESATLHTRPCDLVTTLQVFLAERLPQAAYLVFDGVDGARWQSSVGARDEVSEVLDGAELSVPSLAEGASGPARTWGAVRDEVNSLLRASGWHEALTRLIGAVTCDSSNQVVLVVDYASRLPREPDALSDKDREFFLFAEKLSYSTSKTRRGGNKRATFNPIIWLCSQDRDLPSWFTAGNPRIGLISIPLPNEDERLRAAEILLPAGAVGALGSGGRPGSELAEARSALADRTAGLTTVAMWDIARTMQGSGTPTEEMIGDAVSAYKFGIRESPWKQARVRTNITLWEDQGILRREVLGQEAAVAKALDILKRSVLGLSGAHVAATSTRPKGVLFLAGPTGVGKTELAKQLTRLIYGVEERPLRFDMSEFSAEHAAARLIGAPPGYIGYDAGGELTDAVRAKPFSLLLFDEIEKAHPRILDKFLQILDDGRLTDGRGNTAYFSEALIVFTSNLGTVREVEDPEGGGRLVTIPNVTPDMDPGEVEQRIIAAIDEKFERQLRRPELRSRFGDNIVVFQFIQAEVAQQILAKLLRKVHERVVFECGAELKIREKARKKIAQWCTEDLSKGGRGIGNRLETTFINPLARALFARDVEGEIVVSDVCADGSGQHEVILE
jgi:ATP-dependent Clp protease ATP-binding subunit ClpB